MNKLTATSLLLPTPRKLTLAVGLFFIFGWIVWPIIIESFMTDWYPIGFPLVFHAVGLCPPPGDCIDFRWAALIIDAAFWYLAGAIIVQNRVSLWRFGVGLAVAIGVVWLIAFLLVLIDSFLVFEL